MAEEIIPQTGSPPAAAQPAETVVAPTAVVEAPAAQVEPQPSPEPVETPTILGAEPVETPVEPPKTDEAPKPEAEPVEVKPEDVKVEAVLPVYEDFQLPEGATLAPEKLTEFTSMLGNFENISKADHAEVQKFGQALVNYHLASVQDTVSALQKAYQDSWTKQTAEWLKQFESDPEIGGNRKDTTVSAANEFIRTHGGTPDQQKEFRSLMQKTGLGNNPAMIRMLANANLAKSEGKPLPAASPAPAQAGRAQKWYGKKN